ncbi:TIGR03790 family protein [Pseudoduganella sp. DS3]|uniref:TIGR03790 family protein n=1 Tax=Pseudoduganella guangdongensis TaxID=2692179 RepID=A0A6N9HMW5_9BURK|nr:TIGR03790 family protein [Pseudoduganella guangdongensis]MYN05041.1 TIGR03790 family protein [Pseudoduganella guangdongensis]
MSTSAPKRCVIGALLLLAAGARAQSSAFLGPAQLALVVNDADPASVALGAYYAQLRAIPPQHIAHVRIDGRPARLDAAAFARLKGEIDRQLAPASDVRAVLFAWTAPYAVECNSLTSAYTLGFDAAQCVRSCAPGRKNPYFNASVLPAGMRLSMLLPAEPPALARTVAERGKAAGFSLPRAGAYFLRTSEAARNSRARFFPPSGAIPARKLTIHTLQQDVLEGAQDVMFYQTGMAQVGKLDSLHFLPGALADHLTSYGGDLLGGTQMSSLRWLEAGATASYGTVSEPCNHWQKFPHPQILLQHYLNGASAIEAYWRSVAWPAQGLFIGEPLARPYAR